MHKYQSLTLLAVLTILSFSFTACSTRQTNVVPTTTVYVQTILPLPSDEEPSLPTDTPEPTKSITATPLPLSSAEPTPTPKKEIVWNVPVRSLPDWPVDAYKVMWEENDILQVVANYDEEKTIPYSLQSDPISILPTVVYPTITPFHQLDQQSMSYSPKNNYIIICSEEEKTDERVIYHKLQLVQVENDQLISQINNISLECANMYSPFSWSKDETVFSFASIRTSRAEDPYPIDIYVWKTDGSKPFIIGNGISEYDAGAWSPDNQRLVVELEFAYRIYYLDGTPPKEVFADITSRAFSGLRWVNNDILTEPSSCCGTCNFESFYLAETGEEINALDWSSCFPFSIDAQRMEYSPDNHWVVVDQNTASGPIPPDKTEFAYTLFDLNSKQAYSISKSNDILLDFVGWGDNSTFYLIRRPINSTIQPKPDEPFGLLALDAPTQQMRLINPDIGYAWISPNLHYFLAAIKSDRKLFTAIYTINGKAISKPVELEMPEPNPSNYVPGLDIWDIPSDDGPIWFIWSDDGNKVAFRDIKGTLLLADVQGQVQHLAQNLIPPKMLQMYRTRKFQLDSYGVVWSLNGEYLLIRSGYKAWVFLDTSKGPTVQK